MTQQYNNRPNTKSTRHSTHFTIATISQYTLKFDTITLLITHSTSISTQINLPGRLSSTQPLSVVARPPPVDPLRSQLLIFSPSVFRRCASVRHVLPVDPAVHRNLVHVLVDVADPSSSQTSSADAPNEPSRRRADAARHAHVKLLHRIEMR